MRTRQSPYPEQLKAELLTRYPFKLELHAHTSPASSCSELAPAELISRYQNLGFHAVVITNHVDPSMLPGNHQEEKIRRYLDDFTSAQKAGTNSGIAVLFGMEVRFTENANDYLVYGLEPEALDRVCSSLDKGIKAFYQAFHSDEILIFQAHPFRDGMVRADPSCVDGIETYNLHPHHNSRVGLAVPYAQKHGLLTIAGSDCHHPGHEGTAAVRTRSLPQNTRELAAILCTADYLFQVGGNLILP